MQFCSIERSAVRVISVRCNKIVEEIIIVHQGGRYGVVVGVRAALLVVITHRLLIIQTEGAFHIYVYSYSSSSPGGISICSSSSLVNAQVFQIIAAGIYNAHHRA